MFLARQGGRDGVHSENLVVAGLRDPKTPLSAHDVIERSLSRPHAFGPVWTVRTFPLLLLYYSLLQYYVETVLCL